MKYDSLNKYKKPPLFAPGWLLECNIGLNVSYLKYLQKMPTNNIYLFVVDSKRKLEQLASKFEGVSIEYKAINNLKIPKDVVLDYILSELNINETTAKFLYSRHHGYVKDIVTSVHILKNFDYVTQSIIKKYTVPTSSVKVYDLVTFITEPNKVSYDSIIALLFQYQYGLEYLLKYTVDQLEIYLKIFSYMLDGVVDITNYKVIIPQLNDRAFKDLSIYRVGKIIESFDYISFDKLYFSYLFIKKLGSSRTDLVELINFLRIIKEERNV